MYKKKLLQARVNDCEEEPAKSMVFYSTITKHNETIYLPAL